MLDFPPVRVEMGYDFWLIDFVHNIKDEETGKSQENEDVMGKDVKVIRKILG